MSRSRGFTRRASSARSGGFSIRLAATSPSASPAGASLAATSPVSRLGPINDRAVRALRGRDGAVISLRVNGTAHALDAPPDTTLLQALRNFIGLRGTKEACGRGECGACTVLVGGTPILSCIAFAARIHGEVTTIEGLAEELAELRALFADKGAFQCGFCTSGQLVHAAAILRAGLPTDAEEAED